MVNPDSGAVRFPGDYLYNESLPTMVVVGQVPEGLLNTTVEGLRVERCSNMEDAEQIAVEHHRQAGQAVAQEQLASDAQIMLILQIDATDAQVQQTLGRAVRAFPHRVVAHCLPRMDSPQSVDELFFALGFRRLPMLLDADQPHSRRWFEYRLSQYKSAPDWLNARFWANPERFEIYEDPDVYAEADDNDEEE